MFGSAPSCSDGGIRGPGRDDSTASGAPRAADWAVIAARLPPNYAPATVDPERHAPWLMQCLLEEGDSTDLRWLVSAFGPERLRDWVVARGSRQLSARALAFWRLALDIEAADPPRKEALWPL